MSKLDPPARRLEYSTYLGGAGFSFEGANGIAVDRAGSARDGVHRVGRIPDHPWRV